MHIEQFAHRMMELMVQMRRGFSRYGNNELTRGKITLPQFWVLELLQREKTGKMSDLAELMGVSRPAATGLVDRLIAQGLVTRRNDATDRRVVWIAITAKGKSIIQKIWCQRKRIMVDVFRQIPCQDRKEHLRLCEQLVKTLNSGLQTIPGKNR